MAYQPHPLTPSPCGEGEHVAGMRGYLYLPMAQDTKAKREKNNVGDYFALGDMFGYFFRVFKKNGGADTKPNFNLRTMHTINKISILMFLIGLIFFIVKVAMR